MTEEPDKEAAEVDAKPPYVPPDDQSPDDDDEELIDDLKDQINEEEKANSVWSVSPQPQQASAQEVVRTLTELQERERLERQAVNARSVIITRPGGRQAPAEDLSASAGMRFAMTLSSSVPQARDGNPRGTTMGALRGTGRTTRMLEHAARESVQGADVIVVAADTRSAHALESMWKPAAARVMIAGRCSKMPKEPMFTTCDDPMFCWEPTPNYTPLSHAKVFVDHLAIERAYPAILASLHEHDPNVITGAEGCPHSGAIATPMAQLSWCPHCGSLLFDGSTFGPGNARARE